MNWCRLAPHWAAPALLCVGKQGGLQQHCADISILPYLLVAGSLTSPCRDPNLAPFPQGGSAVYRGGVAGYLSGEGPGLETAQRHKVRITNNYTNEEFEVEVPEDRCAGARGGAKRCSFVGMQCMAGADAVVMHVQTSCLPMASNTCVTRCSSQRDALPLAPAHAPMPPAVLPAPTCNRYILWAAEEEGYDLPYACRLGCCTACTVKVKEGEVYQPHSLGLSKNLRDQVG